MISVIKRSLRAKIFIGGAILVLLFVIFNVLSTYFFLIPFSANASVNTMKTLANDILEKKALPDEQFEDYIEDIANDYNVKIMIVDDHHNILMSSRYLHDGQSKISKRVATIFEDHKEDLDNGDTLGISKNKDHDLTEPIRCVVMKKINEGEYLILSRTLRSLQNTQSVVLYFDIIVAFIALIIGFIVTFEVGKRITKPINEMTVIAENISNLQFDKKVEMTNSEDEIARLGNAINQMSYHLERNIESMQKDIEHRKILVRNLSHELKSPAAVIMAYSDRMKSIIDKNPQKAVEYSQIISNESNRMDVLIREMLNFSRMEQASGEIEFTDVNVNEMVASVIEHNKEECLLKNAEISLECSEEYVVEGNRQLLERALYNLVNNGIKYGSGNPIHVIVTIHNIDNNIVFDVYNSGSHIDDSEIESVWDAFYKVDKARGRNQQGYGIGLSIVREIVESHKGKYAIQNHDDGISFILTIPVKQ